MHLYCLTLLFLVGDEPKRIPPVAMVLEVTGEATLRSGNAPAQPLRDMDLLRPGDRVEASKGQILLVLLEKGDTELLPTGKTYTLAEKGCAPADGIERQKGNLSEPDLRKLKALARTSRAGIGVLRDPETPNVPAVEPLLGSLVLTRRPTFTWPEVKGAARYEVRLFSGMGMDRRPEWKEKAVATKTRLSYPEKEAALPTGVTRYWQVVALDGDGKELSRSEARFSVATETELMRLQALKKLVESKNPNDWLLAAAVYEEYAAYGEALPLYKKLAEKRPGQARYQVALASYYTRAGLPDKAEVARQEAEKLGATVVKPKKD